MDRSHANQSIPVAKGQRRVRATPPVRRSWSLEEKVAALDHFHMFDSKKGTCRIFGISTPKMLREWLAVEDLLRRRVDDQLWLKTGARHKRYKPPLGTRAIPRSQLSELDWGTDGVSDVEESARGTRTSVDIRGSSLGDFRESQVALRAASDAEAEQQTSSASNQSHENCDDHNPDVSDVETPGSVRLRCMEGVSSCAGGVFSSSSGRGDSEGSRSVEDDGDSEGSRSVEDDGAEVEVDEPVETGESGVGRGEGSRGAVSAAAASGTGRVSATASAAVPIASLRSMVSSWLQEDCPSFDYGGSVVGSHPVSATLFAKSDGMLAGTVFFDCVFETLGCSVEWKDVQDGSALVIPSSGKVGIATVTGPARLVLQGERVALNALAECSGIATAASRVVQLGRDAGWGGRIAGTRKTTPGFRTVQKYGMIVGGMDSHRMDLSSMIMLKDNHVAAAGGIPDAVREAKRIGGFSLKVDVECSCLDDAIVAAEAGADVVMLDNFSPDTFREAAQFLRGSFPKLIIEGSGGLTEDTVSSYFVPEADVLSFSINRYATPLDMSLKILAGT